MLVVAAQSAAVALHLQPAADPMALSGATALQLETGRPVLQTTTPVAMLQYQPVIAPVAWLLAPRAWSTVQAAEEARRRR